MDLKPFQKEIYKQFKGRGLVQLTGRQIGKSLVNQYIQQWKSMDYDSELKPAYKITSIESSMVDGELWHTIRCNHEISKWIRSQASRSWYEHPQVTWYSFFDICEELYMMLVLKFGK